MRLGQAQQAISFLSYLKFHQVVFCPLSVMDGWVSEINRFTPNLEFLGMLVIRIAVWICVRNV